MAIATSKTISIVADGQTPWIPLAPGHNRVFVKSTNWSTSSLAISLNSVDSAAGAPAEITDGEPLVVVFIFNLLLRMMFEAYLSYVVVNAVRAAVPM